MSRGALGNQDRRRELREVEIPLDVARMLEPGSRAYVMGGAHIIASQQKAGWHLSISCENRLPTWEEVRDARYAIVPDEATMVLLLPPQSEYVNIHDFCLQLYEIPAEYIEQHQDRL